MKQNRCIILTTQHLREADHLSDRIAILSQGGVLCLGTSTYIKHTFGVGYHLTVSHGETHQEEITRRVFHFIPEAKLPEDPLKTNGDLLFYLPF